MISLSVSVLSGKSNRSDFPLDRSRTALLIIDIQDFLSKPTAAEKIICNINEKYLYEQSLPSVLKNVEILLSSFRRIRYEEEASTKRKGKPEIIFTYLEALTEDCRDISIDYKLSGPPLSSLPTPSTPATFLPNIAPQPDEIRIPKTSCSVFMSTNINYVLRNLNVEQLVLCGQITNQCVESTCRDAADLGYFVTVVQDACAAYSLLDQEHSLSNMMGFARIMNTEQVVQELSHGKVVHPPQEYPSRSAPCSGAAITLPKNSRPPILSLLLALRAAGVRFLRYAALDCANGIRCKAVPLKHLLSNPDLINQQVCIAEACFAGMAGFCDGILNESGFSASNVLVLKPDLDSIRILPYSPSSALAMCTLHNQITGNPSPLCTRNLLQKVIDKSSESLGLAFSVGAELEFVLFRSRLDESASPEPVDYSVFANMITLDEQEGFTVTLCKWLDALDIKFTQIHAESAPGQFEVVLLHQDDALRLADHVVLAKETISACAKTHNLRAVFLPKVFRDQAGNGLHLHISIRRDKLNESNNMMTSENVFVDRARRYGISQLGESFMEGILDHLPALISLTIPSNNSFRRIGQGCWTGSSVAWSLEDKEVPLRVCIDANLGYATNVEFKLCDACCNIYLALACILSCGMEGITRNLSLRSMVDSSKSSGNAETKVLGSNLKTALTCLRRDDLLLGILGEKLSKGYFAVKEAELEHYETWSLQKELDAALKISN